MAYKFSTNNKWAEAHLTWISNYIILKHIPFLKKYPLSEGLHINSLFIPGKNYSEIGYSIGSYKLISFGVFCGFENGKYQSVSFSISVPLLDGINY